MANNTPRQELQAIWNTLIRTNYPDLTTIDNSINLVTMASVPTSDDLANLVSNLVTRVRPSTTIGYNQELSDAAKISLYDEVDAELTALKAVIDALQTAVHTAYEALL